MIGYPAPEWTSRDEMDVPAPGSVNELAARARELGWDVRVQSSRGSRPHTVSGKPLTVKTCWGVVLTFGGGRRAAYAVRDASTWTSVMIWGDAFPFFPLASITDLRDYIERRGEIDGAWFDAIRARVAGADERSAARRGCDAGRHPGGGVEVLGDTAWCVTCGNSWKAAGQPWRRQAAKKDTAR